MEMGLECAYSATTTGYGVYEPMNVYISRRQPMGRRESVYIYIYVCGMILGTRAAQHCHRVAEARRDSRIMYGGQCVTPQRIPGAFMRDGE